MGFKTPSSVPPSFCLLLTMADARIIPFTVHGAIFGGGVAYSSFGDVAPLTDS